jgi:hypothetical protein
MTFWNKKPNEPDSWNKKPEISKEEEDGERVSE